MTFGCFSEQINRVRKSSRERKSRHIIATVIINCRQCIFICAVKSNRFYTDSRWIADPVRDPRTRRDSQRKREYRLKKEREREMSFVTWRADRKHRSSIALSFLRKTLRAKRRQGSANDAIRVYIHTYVHCTPTRFLRRDRACIRHSSFSAIASETREASRRVSGGWRFISLRLYGCDCFLACTARKSKCENDVTCINSHASAALLLSASREIIPPDSLSGKSQP